MSTTHDNPTVRNARNNQVHPTVRTLAQAVNRESGCNVTKVMSHGFQCETVNLGPTHIEQLEEEHECRIGVSTMRQQETLTFHLHGV